MSLGDRVAVMREGAVAQLGPPIDVYDRPADSFVGGFLGSPPMNFLPATVTRRRPPSHRRPDAAGPTICARRACAAQRSSVSLGVRAENIEVLRDNRRARRCAATVQVVEPPGAAVLLTVDVAGQGSRCRRRPASAPSRTSVCVCTGAGGLRLYDKETGLALLSDRAKCRWRPVRRIAGLSGRAPRTPRTPSPGTPWTSLLGDGLVTRRPADEASASMDRRVLRESAVEVLRGNDLGTMTTAAPRLYPHLWSWDAAFVAIGLGHSSPCPGRSRSCSTLLGAQWARDAAAHRLLGPDHGYFPDVHRWGATAPRRPGRAAVGICQPPVHAIAVRRSRCRTPQRAAGGPCGPGRTLRRRDVRPAGSPWHRWLATARDPAGRGLLEIHHGWESGMDNSPRWDGPYSRVRPGELAS